MTEDHWPTLEETEAEDKAAGRIDEAKVVEHRERMTDSEGDWSEETQAPSVPEMAP